MRNVVYEKAYDVPDIVLGMTYSLLEGEKRRVVYDSYPLEGKDEYKAMFGAFCMRCGTFHEWPYFETKPFKCGCGNLLDPGKFHITNCASWNRRNMSRIWEAFPSFIRITEEENRILISVVMKNYYINPIAMKPYTRAFQITIILNIASGQTYFMPAQWDGKKVFLGMDHMINVSFPSQSLLRVVEENVFGEDPAANEALIRTFRKKEPGIPLKGLTDVACANYLKELYPFYCRADNPRYWVQRYKDLRKRYRKDPDTFPKYLYHGCSKVATKSIKRELYRHPEQKWALRFLYKKLGIENTDVLRTYLTDHREATASAMDYYGRVPDNGLLERFASECSKAGMSDKKKAEYLVMGSTDFGLLRDTARMYERNSGTPADIREHRTLSDLHDALIEQELKRANTERWERYSSEVAYDNNIYALEEDDENVSFRIIRRPWDLRALGKRFHNCVGSYMEDVKQKLCIIVEMTAGGKPAACIELDSAAKIYRQAFAPCNKALTGETAESFSKWAERHDLKPGRSGYYGPALPNFDLMPF